MEIASHFLRRFVDGSGLEVLAASRRGRQQQLLHGAGRLKLAGETLFLAPVGDQAAQRQKDKKDGEHGQRAGRQVDVVTADLNVGSEEPATDVRMGEGNQGRAIQVRESW